MTDLPLADKIDTWKRIANRCTDASYPACDLMDAARACEKLLDRCLNLEKLLDVSRDEICRCDTDYPQFICLRCTKRLMEGANLKARKLLR